MNKIDLCIDARMAFSSGIGVFIRRIIPLLEQPAFRLILLVDQEGRNWCQGLEQIVFAAPIYSIKEQLLFPIKIPRCDLFWSPHYNVPLLPIRAKRRVVTIHDVCHLALRNYFSSLERAYARFVMGRALKSDGIATVSQFTKGEISRYFSGISKNIEVIHAAVDQNHFQRVEDPKKLALVRQKYRLADKFILYVGNLKEHKNVQGLAEAFLAIAEPKWQLVLAGKRQGIRNVANDLGQDPRIRILGEVLDEELPLLYSLADLFAFPSFYEGFGSPPLEAMACGCPTIISNRTALPEICGDAALYVDPTSCQDIAKAILRLTCDDTLKKTLIQKGLERVRLFQWQNVVKHYQEFFQLHAR